MKPAVWKPVAAAVAAVLVLAATARADTHIVYADTAGKPGSRLFVKDGKVRLEPGDGGPVVLFESAGGRFTTIDTAARTYTVIDRATMDRIGMKVREVQMEAAKRSGRLTDAQKRVVDAMAQMTPEQRALLEQMMGGLPGLARAPVMEYSDLGTTRTIAGYPCKDVAVLASRIRVAHLCVADLDALSVAPQDRSALQAMHEGIQHMMKAMGPSAPPVPDLIPDGLALLIEPGSPDVPRAREGEILREVTREAVADGLFEVPAGFTKTEVPEPESAGGP
jgi:hypothetical protein